MKRLLGASEKEYISLLGATTIVYWLDTGFLPAAAPGLARAVNLPLFFLVSLMFFGRKEKTLGVLFLFGWLMDERAMIFPGARIIFFLFLFLIVLITLKNFLEKKNIIAFSAIQVLSVPLYAFYVWGLNFLRGLKTNAPAGPDYKLLLINCLSHLLLILILYYLSPPFRRMFNK